MKTKLKVGDYITQPGASNPTYGIVTKQLKNGSFYARVHTSYDGSIAGKAKQASLSNWYPAPIKIDPSLIPAKILTKIGH